MSHRPGTFRRWAPALLALAAACGEEDAVPVYQLVPVERRDIIVTVNATGSIQPVDSVEIKSKASGEIMAVLVETGDVVRTGQRLVRVDPRIPRNTLLQAEADSAVALAQLANAQSQLRRAEELWQTKSITEQEYEQARLTAAQANAAVVRAQTGLENARIAWEDTDVRAPKDGVILAKNIDVGTVIASATGNVAGGTVLLKMANLDTVQVRALVDETDIGKLAAGLDVNITVDAYPNRRFAGQVLKIEPQSIVQQSVTLFPVLVRLPNPDHLLRPGMNAEIAITVGERLRVVAVPNGALRTQRDVASAAGVIGLSMEAVEAQLAAARAQADSAGGQTTLGGAARTGADSAAGKGGDMITLPDGRQIAAPPGVDAKQANAVFAKMQSSGGFQSLTDADRQVLRQLRESGAMGGGGGSGGGPRMMVFRGPEGAGGGGAEGTGSGLARNQRRQQQAGLAFGGDYIVFVTRDGLATAVPVRTGLTDLDYSEVVSGLTEQDSVLILPSASLIASQQEFQNMRNRMGGGLVPGMRQGSGAGGGQVRIVR